MIVPVSNLFDCTVCVPECPENAIFAEDDVPENRRAFIALNVELARAWPTIYDSKDAPSDAAQWKDVEGKLNYLER